MALLQWGEYRPDTADYMGTASRSILNGIPQGDGYAPFQDFAVFSGASTAACRGAFYALQTDGTVAVFQGTSDRLYLLNNTTLTWTPVGKVAALTSISNASPAVVSYTGHPFVANDPVVFSTDDALPAGLTAGTVYYVMSTGLTSGAFQVSATAGGVAINTTDAGSGNHSVTSTYTALDADAQWRFAQFNTLVIAVQENAAPQLYTLGTSTAFADLGGSPPQAAYVDIVGRFVVLSGLASNKTRIQWSGLNAPTTWTSGTNSSDYQDLPDGGIVRGVAGGESGVIFQDQAIRHMMYVPGSPLIFQIERMTQDHGLYAPYSLVRASDKIFFFSAKGFHRIDPGSHPVQIGRERVDRTFFADLDKGNLQLFHGAADPRSSRVFWAYKSVSGTTGLYDKIIAYDFALDRWFQLAASGEYLLAMSQTGITLESLDALSSSIDAMTSSFDNYATSVTPELAQFNSAHKLGFFRGDNLEATFETAEHGADGRRLFVRGFRPITDASSVYGSLSYRDLQSATPTDGDEIAINSRTGRCDMLKSTRYTRFKARIPAATTWTFCAGVEPDVTTEGKH